MDNQSSLSNFQCKKCNYQFFIPSYSFQIIQSTNKYTDSSSKQPVQCPHCKSTDVETLQRSGDLSTVLYGKFSSASDEDKKIMLRKRAKQAMHKDTDQRHEIETKFRGRCDEISYK
jgi:hypothetical protein